MTFNFLKFTAFSTALLSNAASYTSDFAGQFPNLTTTGNTNWGAYVNDDSTGTVTMDLDKKFKKTPRWGVF